MNQKILKMLFLTVLSCNIMQSAENQESDNHDGVKNKFNFSVTLEKIITKENIDDLYAWQNMGWGNALLNTTLMAAIAGIIIANDYIPINSLIQEKHLVKNDFPYAQAWYESMALKYPKAHFDKKLFLQTKPHTHKKFIKWSSSYHHIYCPQESLKDINRIYKNKINDVQLSDEDQLLLAREEFVLLHEAGHIEHNDIMNRMGFVIAYFSVLEFARAARFNYLLSCNNNQLTPSICNESTGMLVLESLLLCLLPIAKNMLSRHQENNADKFSYTQVDDQALIGGISFFENAEIDPLFNIDNKTVSPFVRVNNSIGTYLQYQEKLFQYFHISKLQLINGVPALRGLFKWIRTSTHPYPSDRAQAIKDELARRQTQA